MMALYGTPLFQRRLSGRTLVCWMCDLSGKSSVSGGLKESAIRTYATLTLQKWSRERE